jgi:uncharacterized protein
MAYVRSTPSIALVTTEEVLLEYLNYFAGWDAHFRLKASANVQRIRNTRSVRVTAQTTSSFEMGLDLYAARPDKGYSLTDCVSMQTMREQGLTEALTNDRHFDQEGFRALFREP